MLKTCTTAKLVCIPCHYTPNILGSLYMLLVWYCSNYHYSCMNKVLLECEFLPLVNRRIKLHVMFQRTSSQFFCFILLDHYLACLQRFFGCWCFANILKERDKFNTRSVKCIFLGIHIDRENIHIGSYIL